MKNIMKGIKTGLAIYGGICLMTGVGINTIEKRINQLLDKTEERIRLIFTGEEGTKEKVIEVEFKEVN